MTTYATKPIFITVLKRTEKRNPRNVPKPALTLSFTLFLFNKNSKRNAPNSGPRIIPNIFPTKRPNIPPNIAPNIPQADPPITFTPSADIMLSTNVERRETRKSIIKISGVKV